MFVVVGNASRAKRTNDLFSFHSLTFKEKATTQHNGLNVSESRATKSISHMYACSPLFAKPITVYFYNDTRVQYYSRECVACRTIVLTGLDDDDVYE